MIQYLEIGKVVNTHGVKGEIKVIPLTDNPERFEKLKSVYLQGKSGLTKYTVSSVKYFKGTVILKLKEINDMNAAEALKEQLLVVDRENAVKLPEGSYFICDILDSEVIDEKGNSLGILKEVLQTGSNDVYVVRNSSGRELLIPALKSVVQRISTDDKTINVILPKGLIDDEV